MRIATLLLLIIAITGCNTSGTWNDDHIDLALRQTINGLNAQVIEGLAADKPDKILAVASEALITAAHNDLTSLTQKTAGMIQPGNFKIRNQFFTKNSTANAVTTVLPGLGEEHDYRIAYVSITKESVVTVGEFNNGWQTLAMLTIYGKYGNEWKLNILRMGVLKMANKDAIDWYHDAQQDYKAGDLVDAGNKLSISAQLAKPEENYWSYVQEPALKTFGETLNAAINKTYSFPIKQAVGAGEVAIFHTVPQVLREGYFPGIQYVTSIPLTDTAALSRECDLLHQNISKIFPLIEARNNTILYRAFSRVPTADTERSYGFVRQSK